ncbi:MAG: alpha-amylase family glycosyl hydrolase [Ignavibacteriota bacterium]
MIRIDLGTQISRRWAVPALAVVMCVAMTGLVLATDTTVDVPTKDAGFYMHRFEYDPPAGSKPQKVAVGGEFNNWSETGYPMKADDAGHFIADVKLAEGPHAYRFFVDGAWVNDSDQRSEADLEESNGIRGHNSAVVVGPDGRNLPKPQPGKIAVEGLHYVPTSIRYFDPISASEARIVIAAQAGNVTGAAVYSLAGKEWRRDPLSVVDTRAGMDFFGGAVLSATPDLSYFFELKDGNTTGYFAGGKYVAQIADARRSAWKSSMKPAFETPAWAQRAVWYQIFPERFRDGDKANDAPNTPAWTSKWVVAGAPGANGRGTPGSGNRHFGGDIQGILAELPYLRSLGVTAIYLNPIFKSPSIHKYDTTDYRHVDDGFGYAGDLAEVTVKRKTRPPGNGHGPTSCCWTSSPRRIARASK